MGGTAKVLFGDNLSRNLREATDPESYEAKLRTAIRKGGKVRPGQSGAPNIDIIAPKSYGPDSYTHWNFRDQVSAPNIGKDVREKILGYSGNHPRYSGERYDAKQAYNKDLTASARLHYLENDRHDHDSPHHMSVNQRLDDSFGKVIHLLKTELEN